MTKLTKSAIVKYMTTLEWSKKRVLSTDVKILESMYAEVSGMNNNSYPDFEINNRNKLCIPGGANMTANAYYSNRDAFKRLTQ